MKHLTIALFLAALAAGSAHAQLVLPGAGGVAGTGCVVSGTQYQALVVNSAGTGCTPDASATLNAGALSLGASGTAGSVALGNATSGTVTLSAVAGALGSVTASLPANTGTIAELNVSGQVFTGLQIINLNAAALQAAQTGAVQQLGNANGVDTRVELDSYAAVNRFTCVRADGTAASPTTLQSADQICSINAFGYNGSAYVGPQAALRTFAAQNWVAGSALGTYVDIATTPNGSTTLTQVIQFNNDGGVTVPSTVTGGDKGVGTINAGGLYVNGVAVGGTPAVSYLGAVNYGAI